MAEVLCVYREVAVLRAADADTCTGSVAIISYDEKPDCAGRRIRHPWLQVPSR